MAVMPLVLLPQPVLRQVAQPVDDITDDILQLANNMAETMYAAPGIGLAANQVGIDAQVAVVNVREPLILINPKYIEKGNEILKKSKILFAKKVYFEK